MGRLNEEGKKAAAPTLEELITVRDDIATVIETMVEDGNMDEQEYALAKLGLRLGYIIVGSIVSAAESLRVMADEAEMAMKSEAEEKSDPRFETL